MRSTALKIALIGHSTADLPPLAKSIADHGLRTLELPLAVSTFETATTNSTDHNLENFDLAFFKHFTPGSQLSLKTPGRIGGAGGWQFVNGQA